MAGADPSIYSQIRPFQMSDPLDQMGKALTIRHLMQQGALADEKMAERQDIKAAAQESGGDIDKLSTALLTRGRVTEGVALRKSAAEQKKAEVEQKLKILEAAASDSIALDQSYRQMVQQSGGDQAAATQAMQAIYAPVREKWAGMGHQLPEAFDPVKNFAGIGPAKEMVAYLNSQKVKLGTPVPAVNPATGKVELAQPNDQGGMRFTGVAPRPNTEVLNLGGTSQVIDKDAVTPGQSFQKTATPDTFITDARVRAEGAANRGVTMRGQNLTDARSREAGERDKWSAPVEVTIDGKNAMVRQEKTSGKLFDADGRDVTAKIGPKVSGGQMDPGRVSMALQAHSDLNAFEKLVFPKDAQGKETYDRNVVVAMSVPGTSGVGSKGRMAYSAIENAVAAKLRGETGAATNPGEISNTAARFRPTLMDTEESAKDKVKRLKEFMSMTLTQLKESNHISQATYDKAQQGAPTAPSAGGWSIKPLD